MRRGAPFSLSSSARNKPYRWEHLEVTFYALVTTAGALLRAGALDSISRDLDAHAASRSTLRACEIARDRVGGFRSSQGHIRANNRVEYVP